MSDSREENASSEKVPLQLPTDNVITSRASFTGRLVVLYKRIVKALIDPYLRNVFDKEHEHLRLINKRLALCDRRLDKIESDLRRLSKHQDYQDSRENERQREMIQRIDAVARLLHNRLEKIELAMTGTNSSAGEVK